MLDERYRSKTFEKVNDPACGLYYQGAVYVFQFLKNEIECGADCVRFSGGKRGALNNYR